MYNTLPIEKYMFIHNFLPHPVHRTRARLLSHRALMMYNFLLILFFIITQYAPKLYPGVLGYASDIKVSELLNLTNKKRTSDGLPALTLNEALSKAAYKKAQDMFAKDYWAHVSPDGIEPWDFILAEKYDYSYAGENLAKNFNSSKEVVDAWISSPSHKDNMISKNYDEIGFAVVNGTLDGYKTTLVVQFFGKPRTPSYLAEADKETVNEKILESVSEESETEITAEIPKPVGSESGLNLRTLSYESFPTLIDVSAVQKIVGFTFGGFISGLLAVDIWYSKKKSIPKFTGHTLAHLSILAIAVIGIWLALSPGKIL